MEGGGRRDGVGEEGVGVAGCVGENVGAGEGHEGAEVFDGAYEALMELADVHERGGGGGGVGG